MLYFKTSSLGINIVTFGQYEKKGERREKEKGVCKEQVLLKFYQEQAGPGPGKWTYFFLFLVIPLSFCYKKPKCEFCTLGTMDLEVVCGTSGVFMGCFRNNHNTSVGKACSQFLYHI